MAEPAVPRIVAATAAVTVLLILASAAAWRLHGEWRLGRVELTTDGPPLLLQVLDESGEEPIGEPVDLVTRTTLVLPDGEYRLRVNGVGRLGRTFRLAVNRGETIAYALSLDEGRLLGGDPDPSRSLMRDGPREEPMPFASVTRAMELTPGRSDIVEFTGRSVLRRDGATGKAVWNTVDPRIPYDPGHDPGRWLRRTDPYHWRLQFIEPAMDLDGDGTRDVLLVVGVSHGFLALSGKDGSMLWNHAPELNGPGGPQAEGPDLPGPIVPASMPSQLIGQPAIEDVDGDGTPDLIATLLFQEFPRSEPPPIRKAPGRPGCPCAAGESSRRSRADRDGGCGVTRSTRRSRRRRLRWNIVRRRWCAAGDRRSWASSTDRGGGGSGLTRRPAGQKPGRSIWASCPFAPSDTPTSMATASLRSW